MTPATTTEPHALTFLSEANRDTIAAMPESPERDALAGEARRAFVHYRQLLGRGADLRTRRDALTAELPDANERRRKAIHAERAELEAELAFLPDDAALAARRFAEALSAWSRRTYNQALYIHDQTVGELNQQLAQVRQIPGDQQPEARAALLPLYRRRDEARKCLEACSLSSRFGDRSKAGGIDAGELERFVAHARRAVA